MEIDSIVIAIVPPKRMRKRRQENLSRPIAVRRSSSHSSSGCPRKSIGSHTHRDAISPGIMWKSIKYTGVMTSSSSSTFTWLEKIRRQIKYVIRKWLLRTSSENSSSDCGGCNSALHRGHTTFSVSQSILHFESLMYWRKYAIPPHGRHSGTAPMRDDCGEKSSALFSAPPFLGSIVYLRSCRLHCQGTNFMTVLLYHETQTPSMFFPHLLRFFPNFAVESAFRHGPQMCNRRKSPAPSSMQLLSPANGLVNFWKTH